VHRDQNTIFTSERKITISAFERNDRVFKWSQDLYKTSQFVVEVSGNKTAISIKLEDLQRAQEVEQNFLGIFSGPVLCQRVGCLCTTLHFEVHVSTYVLFSK
jgi:hypothetical protein